ncbi:farnesol dehydrogenase-like [Haematobia irritans]|uniref:farnesol dehydrogenase-like n=1 Tax=Haematobia irritans TaxID=7368 RepID=UPI003F5051AA
MDRWQNKIAVITGAGSGIGAATARILVAKGLIVVGLDSNLEAMGQTRQTLPKELQTKFYCKFCDIANEMNVKETFQWIIQTLGGVDILVNNAGILAKGHLLDDHNSEDIKKTLEVNVLGMVWCTREAFRSMKERSFDGHIVNLCSIAGHSVPALRRLEFNIYPPSKYAVKAMSEVLRQEFLIHKTKIKVTNISPGGVRTSIFGPQFPDMPSLSPDDIADAIVYCIQTPPNVQIYELIIKPIGEQA